MESSEITKGKDSAASNKATTATTASYLPKATTNGLRKCM